MNSNAYTIRPYKPGDEVSINRGFNEVFGMDRSLDEWCWKFGRDGDGDSNIMLALGEDNEVLVNFSTLDSRIKIDGKILKCAQAVDCYSLQRDYVVRKKLYLKTYDAYRLQFGKNNEIAFLYGCLGRKHLKLGRLMMNYTEHVPITYLSKQMNFLCKAWGILMSRPIWNFFTSRNDVEVNKVGDLWTKSSGRYAVSVIRDKEYIYRRYLSRPGNKYYYVTVESNDLPAGFAVLTFDNRILKWVDLIWDGRDSSIITELERRIWNLAVKLGVRKVEMWLCNDDEVKELLKTRGLLEGENPYELFITTTPLKPEIDSYELSKRMYLTMGDTDMF